MRSSRKHRGFTLVEVMIASLIFLLSTGLMFSMAYALRFAERQEQMQNEAERTVVQILDSFSRDANMAKRVVDSWSGIQTGEDALVLELPNYDENEVEIPGGSDHVYYVFYSGTDGRIERTRYSKDGEAVQHQEAENVKDCRLFFDYMDYGSKVALGDPIAGTRILELVVEVELERNDRLYSRQLTQTATIRNP